MSKKVKLVQLQHFNFKKSTFPKISMFHKYFFPFTAGLLHELISLVSQMGRKVTADKIEAILNLFEESLGY